jgi:hypothetical protein
MCDYNDANSKARHLDIFIVYSTTDWLQVKMSLPAPEFAGPQTIKFSTSMDVD